MNTLRFKLISALLIGTIITVTLVAVLVRRATTREFAKFVQRDVVQRTALVRLRLERYYQRVGSWDNIEQLLAVPAYQLPLAENRAPRHGRQPQPQATAPQPPESPSANAGAITFAEWDVLPPETHIVLADAEWQVVWDSRHERGNTALDMRERAVALPLTVNDATVGYLLTLNPQIGRWSQLQQEYLERMDQSLLRAGIITGFVGIILGILLAQQLTAPLRALTAAVRRMEQGDFTQRVEVVAQDEIGELGSAFNQMAAVLAEQDKWRKRLMSDIAHELRTPISVIQGQLEALLDGIFPMNAEQVASIHDETLQLVHLVDDLRELAWADAGQTKLNRAPTDIIKLGETVVNNFRPQAAEHEVNLNAVYPKHNAPKLILNIDAARIRQVLANLVSNALRHTPRGGSVEVRFQTDKEMIQICVADTGSGIAPDDLPYIFDRFYKGDKARGGGAGLGLAIARQWVEAHGGRIWVENRPSGGAQFCFTIPTKT